MEESLNTYTSHACVTNTTAVCSSQTVQGIIYASDYTSYLNFQLTPWFSRMFAAGLDGL